VAPQRLAGALYRAASGERAFGAGGTQSASPRDGPALARRLRLDSGLTYCKMLRTRGDG